MNAADVALSRFAQGFSCSQAVLSAYAEQLGLDSDTALKIASGFGGGMGRMADTCGAVTGAFAVLGLKYGPTQPGREGKEAIYARIRDFAAQFTARNDAVDCRDLLGCDISTPEGLRLAVDEKRFSELCPKFVRDACEILEEMLKQ